MARYLIVDDSPTIRLTVAAAVKRAGRGAPEILEADSAARALQIFLERRPDIVFLDMMLTDAGGGLQLMQQMLAHRPEARVVLLTGLTGDHPDVRQAVSLGAFAHLQKPVRAEAIQKVFDTVDREDGRLGRIR